MGSGVSPAAPGVVPSLKYRRTGALITFEHEYLLFVLGDGAVVGMLLGFIPVWFSLKLTQINDEPPPPIITGGSLPMLSLPNLVLVAML
jgi:hypothetical protein